MQSVQVLLALALLTLTFAHGDHGTITYDPCFLAYLECDWEFYNFPGKIPVFPARSKPDRPFTPRIVSKNPNEKIGIVNSNNIIPQFIVGKYAFPITKFSHPPFTPTHFKPYPIDYVMGSGIGHQTFHGNQKNVAKAKCVRVFFTAYQKLMYGSRHPMVKNINAGKRDYKCVVFRLN